MKNHKQIILAMLYLNGKEGLNINDYLNKNSDLSLKQFFEIIRMLNFEFKITSQCFQIHCYDYLCILQINENILNNIIKFEKKEIILSNISMEILAIVSQNPNITRPQINKIRGIDSNLAIQKLIKKRFLRISGIDPNRANAKTLALDIEFYKYFNIESLNSLPKLDKINFDEIEDSEIEFLSNKFSKEENISLDEIKKGVNNGKNS